MLDVRVATYLSLLPCRAPQCRASDSCCARKCAPKQLDLGLKVEFRHGHNQQRSISKYRKQGAQINMRYPSRFCPSLKVRTLARRVRGAPRTALALRDNINQSAYRNKMQGGAYMCMSCVAMYSELAPYPSTRTPSATISPAFGPKIT